MPWYGWAILGWGLFLVFTLLWLAGGTGAPTPRPRGQVLPFRRRPRG